MGKRIRKLKKQRIHREGTGTLIYSLAGIVAVAVFLHWIGVPAGVFWSFVAVVGIAWAIVLKFYRCPIREFKEDTERIVVAPADGKIVVV